MRQPKGLFLAGPPLKRSVKYLGAHIQTSLSTRLEVTKRIAAARTGFSKFAAFFSNSRVPQLQKNAVFKSVVNEAILAALEVRTLTASDVARLEAARGMLLRKIFGKAGFGAVEGAQQPQSVPLSLLRQRCGLVSVACELQVRRILWLRSALISENEGEVRLDLAVLFGTLLFDGHAPVGDDGLPTSAAPSFLRLLHEDLQAFLPHWTGFVAGWQEQITSLPRTEIVELRKAELRRGGAE